MQSKILKICGDISKSIFYSIKVNGITSLIKVHKINSCTENTILSLKNISYKYLNIDKIIIYKFIDQENHINYTVSLSNTVNIFINIFAIKNNTLVEYYYIKNIIPNHINIKKIMLKN